MPINLVRAIADELIKHGEVRRGHLGVTLQELNSDIAAALGLPAQQAGALVTLVRAGSAAEKTGLLAGDVIVGVNGTAVGTMQEASIKLAMVHPNTVAQIDYLRHTKLEQTAATLTAGPPGPVAGTALSPALDGAEFGPVGYFVPISGAEVVAIRTDSEAWNAGFRKGDIIRSLNQEDVSSVEQLLVRMQVSRPHLLFNVVREGHGVFILVPPLPTR
jgi:S1-C subfamily serine protease